MLTVAILCTIMPKLSRERAAEFLPHLIAAMERFGITTPGRVAAFLGQIAHESGQLTRWAENMNYSAERMAQVWPKRFRGPDGKPNAKARALDRKPELIAEEVYGGRADLGNRPGDGWRFRGQSPIQTTGRHNVRAVGKALGLPLEDQPELLQTPAVGFLAAAHYWASHGCNEIADAGPLYYDRISARINPHERDPKAKKSRESYYGVARRALGVIG